MNITGLMYVRDKERIKISIFDKVDDILWNGCSHIEPQNIAAIAKFGTQGDVHDVLMEVESAQRLVLVEAVGFEVEGKEVFFKELYDRNTVRCCFVKNNKGMHLITYGGTKAREHVVIGYNRRRQCNIPLTVFVNDEDNQKRFQSPSI